jgi:hypothetical protein
MQWTLGLSLSADGFLGKESACIFGRDMRASLDRLLEDSRIVRLGALTALQDMVIAGRVG